MTEVSQPSIEVPLEAGSRVTLLDDVDTDAGGSAGVITFEDSVERYVPDTSLLEFEESDVGLAEFRELVSECESIEIIRNP